MALAHQIGTDKCTVCTVLSQDISQKSNKMIKLNLISIFNLLLKNKLENKN